MKVTISRLDGFGSSTQVEVPGEKLPDFKNEAQALIDAGVSEALVRKIFYQNARRVLCPHDK